MRWSGILRCARVSLFGAVAFAFGVRSQGATPGQAAFAGLLIALGSSGLIALILSLRHMGRALRRGA
jgi:hypothetical protein